MLGTVGTHKEHKESNLRGSGSFFQSFVMGPNAEAVKPNGVESGSGSGSSEIHGNGILKYKRRRNSKISEDGKVSDDSVSLPCEKSVKYVHHQAHFFQNGSHSPKALFDDCSLRHQRNIILEHISQSLDSEGGLKSCINNALVFHPGNGSRTSVKESLYSCDERRKCIPRTRALCGPQKALENNLGMTSNGSVNESKHCTITKLCERTFSDIITSEKFTQLCSLLVENFQGFKADKIFNLNHINSRMKESTYESSPLLFQSDIQELWMKLQKVGSDITALAKCLSDQTASSFCEQVGNSARGTQDSKYQLPTQESNFLKAYTPDEAHRCRHCQQKADGQNSLICDSCEEMFHVSCINPPVKEFPPLSWWYCSNCTPKEIESPHKGCVACERLINTTSREENSLPNDTIEELQSSKESLSSDVGSEEILSSHCKVCRTEVQIGGEDYRICGHSFCSHKFYHVRCLTGKQLAAHGPCWYCPSCLCGVCFTDQDDDKIVLCDGCDHAYHIYCMHPPRVDIPEGKWFCEKCESGLVRVREARRAYGFSGKEGLEKSGGVDMLLNAAKTLNYEENLAFMRLETE